MAKKPKTSRRKATSKTKPLVIAKQGHFYVGGRYYLAANGQMMAGQAYVEFQIPAKQRQRFPLVMIHGGGQTGENFTGTPDGRDGWAQYFLRQGYAVYIVDQPGRGRACYDEPTYGRQRRSTAERIRDAFAAPEHTNRLPMTKRHKQWPGKGAIGDPVFDQFYASQVPSIEDAIVSQTMNCEAAAALLDRIGPAILMTHSQSGTYGWQIADACPKKVKAIVAIEPGAVYADIEGKGPPDWYSYSIGRRPWGLGALPLAYDPPVSDPSELRFVQEDKPQRPELARVFMQAEPARQLKNLKGLPIVVVTGEASFHKPYDHGTVQFLNQAGAKATHIPLEDVGLRGNGHMMMLEKNNQEIAAVIHGWIKKTLPPRR
jgi:pimeloyl-ACP methyl ester carboxylesterase